MVSGEISRGEKMLESGTDPESYITEYTLVYEENNRISSERCSEWAVARQGTGSAWPAGPEFEFLCMHRSLMIPIRA